MITICRPQPIRLTRPAYEPYLPRKDPMAQRGQRRRDGPDFWPTPASLIDAACTYIVPFLKPWPVWECARGDGRLERALQDAGCKVLGTDLYPQDGGDPVDFLADEPPGIDGLVAMTNCPFTLADEFIARGLQLIDDGRLRGLVLLLRHDHFMSGGKAMALNRATFEVHCNWRPIWIEGTSGNPRWAFTWVYWGPGERWPPLYLSPNPCAAGKSPT